MFEFSRWAEAVLTITGQTGFDERILEATGLTQNTVETGIDLMLRMIDQDLAGAQRDIQLAVGLNAASATR